MHKSSRFSLDRHITGPDPNTLLPLTKSETSTNDSMRPNSHEHKQGEFGSQDEPESEDDVGWFRLVFVVIALILSMFMVRETSVHGCGWTLTVS